MTLPSTHALSRPRPLPRLRYLPFDPVLAPVLVISLLLVALPLGFLVYASLVSAPPGARTSALTGAHWAQLFNEHGREAILNTLQVSVYVTVCALLIGACLAWLVGRTDMRFGRQFSVLLVTPMLLSPLLTTLAWTVLASPRAGLVNAAFQSLTGASGPLLNIYSMTGMVLVMVLYFAPFAYLIMLGALQGVDASLEHASRIAGAGMLTTLRRITLPVVTPAILSAGLLIFALACEQLAVPTLLGLQAKIPTLQYEVYLSMVDSPSNPNYAAAAGCFLLLFTVVSVLLYGRMAGVSRRFVTVSGKAWASTPIQLGRWRYAALLVCTLYLVLAVVAPFGALLLGSFLRYVTPAITGDLLTFTNYQRLLANDATEVGLRNTFLLGFAGSTITLIFSAVVSYLTIRSRSLPARVLEFCAMLPLSVPSISLGLGVLWTYVGLPIGIYGTTWILLIAYLTRLSPQGIRSISATLVQIDPELEQSARVHGASRWRSVRDITMQLLRPALLAAWVLLFVQTILEISMTVMLYTPQTTTAALRIWFSYFGGDTLAAYSLAVILAAVSFGMILIGQRFFGLL
ncbi:MAG: iron ABC transporter permease, partial [Chloroflexi bacterium]|nr:iron ABC transporter permease [Chloroflexota bacterium]